MAKPHFALRARLLGRLAAVSQGLLPVARNSIQSTIQEVAASSFACRIAAISVSTLGDGAGRAYPARGAELGTPPRQGGKGTEILEKGILPRLGARSWGYLPGWGHGTSPQRGKRGDRWRAPTCQSISSEHVFSNICRAPIQLVICDGRRSLLARCSPSPVCDRLLARQGLLFDDGCRNIARASTSGTSTSNRGISSSTQGTWTSTRGPRHRFRKHRPRPRVPRPRPRGPRPRPWGPRSRPWGPRPRPW